MKLQHRLLSRRLTNDSFAPTHLGDAGSTNQRSRHHHDIDGLPTIPKCRQPIVHHVMPVRSRRGTGAIVQRSVDGQSGFASRVERLFLGQLSFDHGGHFRRVRLGAWREASDHFALAVEKKFLKVPGNVPGPSWLGF